MAPTLGFLYRFPTFEVDDDWEYERNALGRVVNRLRPITYSDNYGIFVGTHGDYNLFADYIPTQYTDENTYHIFYIKKNEEIEEMESLPEIPYIDYVEWFVGSSAFPHPVAIDNERRTTYVRVTDTDIEAAWRQHLQNRAIAHGKHLSAKRIATWMTALPPTGRFSGGPFYKKAKANFKAGSRKSRRKSKSKSKTRKA